MRVLIIGAGAVGSFVGARLALAGHEVTLAGRPGLAAVVHDGGLTLIEPSGSRRAANVSAVDSITAAFSTSTLEPIQKPAARAPMPAVDAVGAASAGCSDEYLALTSASIYDLALVTVKAYDTESVIAELRAAGVNQLPPLLTLQNGVGNEEALAKVFGADRIVAGAIDTPVSVPAPGRVQVHRERFKAGVAPVGRAAPGAAAAGLLRDAGFTVGIFADYRRLKWSKLLMNLLANAQCAILDWTPAQVMADPVASRLEALAWQEAFAVMAAQGIRPVAMARYPLPILAPLVRRISPGLLARGLQSFVAGGRGSKMPSLHGALADAKRSEVAWLNGAVVAHGARLGIPTPVNRALTDALTALTDGRASRDAWRGQTERLAGLI